MRLIGLAGVLVLSQFLAPIAAETQPGGPGFDSGHEAAFQYSSGGGLRLAPRNVIG